MEKFILVEDAVLRDTFWNAAVDLKKENDELKQRIKRLEEALGVSWGIIANVSGGNWTEQKPVWVDTAVRWRDDSLIPLLKDSQ